jgi:hypothetical protein
VCPRVQRTTATVPTDPLSRHQGRKVLAHSIGEDKRRKKAAGPNTCSSIIEAGVWPVCRILGMLIAVLPGSRGLRRSGEGAAFGMGGRRGLSAAGFLDMPIKLLYNCLRLWNGLGRKWHLEKVPEKHARRAISKRGQVRRRSSVAEQLFCKQLAVSSNLTVGSRGGCRSGQSELAVNQSGFALRRFESFTAHRA